MSNHFKSFTPTQPRLGPARVGRALRRGAPVLALAALLGLAPLAACYEVEGGARFESPHGAPSRVSVRGAPVEIKESESIRGDLVVIGGRATVDGEVKGNLVVVGGHLRVGPKARVRGDLVSVGNRTSELAPEAQVKGTRVEVSHGLVTRIVGNVLWAMDHPTAVVLTACFVLLALLALVYLLIVRRYDSARFHATVEHRPVRAAILGLILFAALHLLAVAAFFAQWGLGVTIALWLTVALLYVAGWLSVAHHVGRAVARRSGWQMNAALTLLLGVGVALLAFLVPVLGQLAWTVGTWIGVGALLDPMPLAEIPPPAAAPAGTPPLNAYGPDASTGTAGTPPTGGLQSSSQPHTSPL